MVPAGNKAKRLSLVSHTTKTIHHHRQKIRGVADTMNMKKEGPEIGG